MKKILFWATTPLTFVLFVIFGFTEMIGHGAQEGLHMFEGWCLNYKDTGLVYRGDGIWSSRNKWDD